MRKNMIEKKSWLDVRWSTSLLAMSFLWFASATVNAQTASESTDGPVIEELIVTGSYLRNSQKVNASPIASFDRDEFSVLNASTLEVVVANLTSNTGSQNNVDSTTQLFTTGTSNFNLRGLGVGSTLVLQNSRRQVQSSISTNAGDLFVDTASLLPTIAVSRVDILEDGASSLYGSDAIAGVVNFVTRSDFDGFEIDVGYQSTTEDSQEDLDIQLIGGTDIGKGHIVAALSYLDRSDLSQADRNLRNGPEGTADFSNVGQPGAFFTLGTPTGPNQDFVDAGAFSLVMDPSCAAVAAVDPNVVPQNFSTTNSAVGRCRFNFGEFFSIVPETTRLNFFSEYNVDLTDSSSLFAEVSYAKTESIRENSPSFPNAAGLFVSADHPNNPFGTNGIAVVRVAGAGASSLESNHDSDTLRLYTGFSSSLNDNWQLDGSLTYGKNEFFLRFQDNIQSALDEALGNTDTDGLPGLGGEIYNPFGSSFFASPGDPEFNSPELLEQLFGALEIDSENELTVLEAILSGSVGALSGGEIGLALGLQYRRDDLSYDANETANNLDLALLTGLQDFSADRDVSAAFFELGLPFTDTVNLNLSGRYEDYGGTIGDNFSPKASILFTPTDSLSFRGSVSRSFRAPSLFQESGELIIVEAVAPGTFRPTFSEQDLTRPLTPEEATSINIGATYQAPNGFTASIDYWNYDYEDVITRENVQTVFATLPNQINPIGETNPNNVNSLTTFFLNAAALDTDGIDIDLDYGWETSNGSISLFTKVTRVLSYDLVTLGGTEVDGLGQRNFFNFGVSAPELRANAGVRWTNGKHSVNATFRHIGSYEDDEGNREETNIDSFNTIDLQYTINLGGNSENKNVISIGLINATDEDIPGVETNRGFDTKVHDPRGRLAYARYRTSF